LSKEVLDDLEFLYSRFENGILLIELAVDYPDHHDVDGFLRYVAEMTIPEFLFYILGRLAPEEEMATLEPSLDSLLYVITQACPEGDSRMEKKYGTEDYVRLVADPDGYRTRILRLWRRYWDSYFREESERYRQLWEESVEEKSLALSRQDALEFFKKLSDKPGLPDQIPPGYPTSEIVLVPACFGHPPMTFIGYGSITVIYDCHLTEEHRDKLRELEEEIVAAGKALGDNTRLQLLKWIVREPQLYGRKLAELCHISQPSVSRHLRILKDAGLIEERPMDNYIAYEVRRDRIEDLSPQLTTYLYEEG
jgi:ArsR family transcriptional regulator